MILLNAPHSNVGRLELNLSAIWMDVFF